MLPNSIIPNLDGGRVPKTRKWQMSISGLAGRFTLFVSRAHARSPRVDAETERTPEAFARVGEGTTGGSETTEGEDSPELSAVEDGARVVRRRGVLLD